MTCGYLGPTLDVSRVPGPRHLPSLRYSVPDVGRVWIRYHRGRTNHRNGLTKPTRPTRDPGRSIVTSIPLLP